MKLKKLVASTLVASMVVSGVATLSTQKEISATTAAPAPVANPDYVGVAANGKAYPNAVLMANAKAKSEHPNHSSEGKASYAFDNNDGTMWHTNYAQNSEQNQVKDGRSSWIQTGFSTTEKLKKLTYLARNGSPNNKILDYELWVSTQDKEPSVSVEAVEGQNGWHKVQTGKFKEDSLEETITLSTAENAKWVRLVAKSTKLANGNNHAVATKIELFTEEIHYNQNNYAENWDYQVASGKMNQQDNTDRWVFEKLDNSVWSNMDTANWSSQWIPYQHYSIARDGFRSHQAHSTLKGLGVSWVAPREGYYEFSQTKTPSTRALDGGSKVKLDYVYNSGVNETNLKTPANANEDVFTTSAVKMKVGDKFRFHTEIRDRANYCDFAGNLAPWSVEDVTKKVANTTKADADKLLTTTTADSKYKEALTTAKNELEGKLTATNDELVPAIEKVNTAMNQLKNIKLMNYIDTVSGYTWTNETAVKAALEVAKTAGDKVLTEVELNDAIKALRSAVNTSTRTYTIKLAKDGKVVDTIAAANYNTVASKDCTISAPTTGSFKGWYRTAANGKKYLVSSENTFKVAALSDVTYDALYSTEAPVQSEIVADIQNAFLTKVDTKFTATIAGKLALPANVNLSEVTELKVLAKLSPETTLVTGADKNLTVAQGVKQFDIAKVNKYNQFSLKLTEIAADSDLTVQIYVKTANGTYVSQAVTLTAN